MKKILGLLLVVLLTSATPKPKETMKLYYVYDGLCGWCYGFSPTMNDFANNHQEELEIEAVAGGMITGDRIGPIGEVLSFLTKEDFERVETYTGVKYGEQFMNGLLKDGKATFTSIPSAVALAIFKEQKPAKQIAFAGKLLKAVYFDGMEPTDYAAYGELAAEFGLNAADFTTKMEDAKYLALAKKDFQLANDLGVNGFPTLVLEYQGQRVIMARGYTPAEQLEQQFIAAKEQLEK